MVQIMQGLCVSRSKGAPFQRKPVEVEVSDLRRYTMV
jgi:hypothetical protein